MSAPVLKMKGLRTISTNGRFLMSGYGCLNMQTAILLHGAISILPEGKGDN